MIRSSYRTDKVLFACHANGEGGGALLSDMCLPLAFERNEDDESSGFHTQWSAEADAYDFFFVAFDNARPPARGLWVYETTWNTEDVDPVDCSHLHEGTFRRPTTDELNALARGECPWADGVLL